MSQRQKIQLELKFALLPVKEKLLAAYGADTMLPGTIVTHPTSGQCAVTAIIVKHLFGGDFMSATVNGQSHWYNRVPYGGLSFEVDLTSEQFGVERLIAYTGCLHEGCVVRPIVDINNDTWDRAIILANRAGISDNIKVAMGMA